MTTRSSDSHIIDLWVPRQASPHTRGCYRRDAARLFTHVRKPLSHITLGEPQRFTDSLGASGPAPGSRSTRWPR